MPYRTDVDSLIEALNKVGALMAADAGLEQIMQNVTDAAVRLTGAGQGAFFYAGPDRGRPMNLFTVSGFNADHAKKMGGHPRETPLFAPTTSECRIVRAYDVTQDPRFGKMGGMPEGHFKVRSYLAAPVRGNAEKPVGSLLLGHENPGVFDEGHERLVAALCHQAAAAFDNQRLFQSHLALEDKLLAANERLEGYVKARTEERDRLWRLSTDCMVVLAPDTTIVAANPAWEKLFGWNEAELVGKKSIDFVHDDDRHASLEVTQTLVRQGSIPHFENRYRDKKGSYRTLAWSAVSDGSMLHGVGRDVTAEREQAAALERVREELRQSHKREAIGVLARGVAHEFANCAAAVLAALRLLRRRHGGLLTGVPAANDALVTAREAIERLDFEGTMAAIDALSDILVPLLDSAPGAEALLNGANEAATRGGATARRLLSYAKRGTLKPQPIPVVDLMNRIRDGLVAAAAGEDNEVIVEPPDCCHGISIMVDPGQLAVTLIALVMNARAAMPGGGRIIFRCSTESVSDGKQAGLFGGDYVRLDVIDNGTGMDAITLSRAAEPFFTTHPESDGKGLGLSSALGFAEQSGGSLRIKSAPGQGTTVSLWLPREAKRCQH